jgi:4-aminobutyrate aminotransferase
MTPRRSDLVNKLSRRCLSGIAMNFRRDRKTLNDQHQSADALRVEGDVNASPRRRAWREQLDPETRRLLDADDRVFVHQSLSTPCLDAVTGCEGVYLIDQAGRRLMDFHGNSAHQIGYNHPRVIAAIEQQLGELSFCPRRYTNRPAIDLAERLVNLTGRRLTRVLFTPSGTAAMGIALKLTRYATCRYKTISMQESFHGASLDAISIGGEALFRDGLGPLLPGCLHVPWPHTAGDADDIAEMMSRESDIAAVIAEPMRCTTVEMPPPEYWQRVRQLCDAYEALLVFDEIPLALGRTGRMFCYEHTGVVPDILVIGKGLGGGVLPLAAVLVREALNIAPDRAVGHYTHEKSPLAAAAAIATLDVIEQENLARRAQELGARMVNQLRDLQASLDLIREVRGVGLSIAVELARDGKKANDEAEAIMYGCLARGLSFKVSSGNVLTLTPPLTISTDELDKALQILAGEIGKA